MRKLVFTALLCAAAFALAPSAEALTTAPSPNGVRLIPTYAGPSAAVTPIQYYHRHHRRFRWRHHRREYY